MSLPPSISPAHICEFQFFTVSGETFWQYVVFWYIVNLTFCNNDGVEPPYDVVPHPAAHDSLRVDGYVVEVLVGMQAGWM